MNEDFLHYIWKYKLLFFNNLKTEDGQIIQVVSQGFHNYDAGPDFFNARIKIDDTLWAGNVEIHLKSSDWYLHKHNMDKKYDNIILHVVYDNDTDIYRTNNEKIPVVSIKNRFDESLLLRYKTLLANKSWVPCEKSIAELPLHFINIWKEKLIIERLIRKTADIERRLSVTKNDWEQVFYEHLCRNFGFKVNATAFEMLARALPQKYIAKHSDSPLQTAALLFGQAGFLSDTLPEAYPLELYKEYLFLKAKYSLTPIDASLWNFLRIRPQNFPYIRLAQLASLLRKEPFLFSKILDIKQPGEVYGLFKVNIHEYWNSHFTFAKGTNKKETGIGAQSIWNIAINTVVPFLFAYGHVKKEIRFKEKAFEILEKIPPEDNAIVKKWKVCGLAAISAYDTQALIELKNNYCNHKKCLSCMIGDKLLRNQE